jgi:hypothetical protein
MPGIVDGSSMPGVPCTGPCEAATREAKAASSRTRPGWDQLISSWATIGATPGSARRAGPARRHSCRFPPAPLPSQGRSHRPRGTKVPAAPGVL